MPIKGNRYEFTQTNVDGSPDEHGVYQLEDGISIIYIGRAAGVGVTIRSRLQAHKRGDEGPCTRAASHYRREVTDSPVTRERELLNEYQISHGFRLPRCNEVMP